MTVSFYQNKKNKRRFTLQIHFCQQLYTPAANSAAKLTNLSPGRTQEGVSWQGPPLPRAPDWRLTSSVAHTRSLSGLTPGCRTPESYITQTQSATTSWCALWFNTINSLSSPFLLTFGPQTIQILKWEYLKCEKTWQDRSHLTPEQFPV